MAESQAFPSALPQVSGKEYNHITLHDHVRAHLGDNYTFLQERAETPPEPTSNIPFRRDPDFVERGDLLDQIGTKVSQPAAKVALVGLGGIGKSQLAIEYCYRLRERSRETWVLWIHASNAARFEQGVREIASLAKIRGRDDPKANIFELVRDWLRSAKSGRWILVLDNVDDASFLLEPGHGNQGTQGSRSTSDTLFRYRPVCDRGSILITTRSEAAARKLVEHSDMINVGTMKDGDALRGKIVGAIFKLRTNTQLSK